MLPDEPRGSPKIAPVADGTVILIAEVYKGASTTTAKLLEKYPALIGMTLLTPEEHHGLLTNEGYANVQLIVESAKGRICVAARKPASKL
jgi:formylmethanofuran dehydrogenase subunit D